MFLGDGENTCGEMAGVIGGSIRPNSCCAVRFTLTPGITLIRNNSERMPCKKSVATLHMSSLALVLFTVTI
jgi:hypothetical protein